MPSSSEEPDSLHFALRARNVSFPTAPEHFFSWLVNGEKTKTYSNSSLKWFAFEYTTNPAILDVQIHASSIALLEILGEKGFRFKIDRGLAINSHQLKPYDLLSYLYGGLFHYLMPSAFVVQGPWSKFESGKTYAIRTKEVKIVDYLITQMFTLPKVTSLDDLDPKENHA